MTRRSGLARFNMSVPMMPLVSLFLGRCTVMKSLCAIRSSSDIISTLIWRARSADTNGS
ncbi:unannotated protein [freshwater metagenome]|uniref:Unannotated protein n=1 Tax=freshwater metagenome TaxID=449393 RepID=A0A6J6FHA0_9ZZZZ